MRFGQRLHDLAEQHSLLCAEVHADSLKACGLERGLDVEQEKIPIGFIPSFKTRIRTHGNGSGQ
jgi:hypothetical protein